MSDDTHFYDDNNYSLDRRVPFSCMYNLIQNHSNCNTFIPEDKRRKAYQAFSDVTGYKPLNLSSPLNTINEQNKKIANLTVVYLFLPIFIIIFVVTWLLVGFNWIDWIVGLYFIVFAFTILYVFSIFYRIHVNNYIDSTTSSINNYSTQAQENFENSIPYLPQGLYSIACAITGSEWKCNEKCDEKRFIQSIESNEFRSDNSTSSSSGIKRNKDEETSEGSSSD